MNRFGRDKLRNSKEHWDNFSLNLLWHIISQPLSEGGMAIPETMFILQPQIQTNINQLHTAKHYALCGQNNVSISIFSFVFLSFFMSLQIWTLDASSSQRVKFKKKKILVTKEIDLHVQKYQAALIFFFCYLRCKFAGVPSFWPLDITS